MDILMAEAFLFPLAQSLFTKPASYVSQEIGRIWDVKSDLKRLEGTFSSIKAVLSDAAQQQVRSEHIKDCLDKLQDALYELDDLFDDYTTEKMRRQLEIGDRFHKEVSNFFSRSNKIRFRVAMSNKIKKLTEILDEIDKNRRNYKFMERVLCSRGIHGRPRAETHAYVPVANVIGRDDEKNKLLRLLLHSKTGHATLGVLPIFGLGGVGKTTLTQLVYNDPKIEGNFEKKLWVCVSEYFEIKHIVTKILKADTLRDFSFLDLDQLITSLRNRLKSKKFFLVLDDVWNEDPVKWSKLIELLDCGAKGSKVVVTTRSQRTAGIVRTLEPLYLKRLSSGDDCLSIFLKYAFKDGNAERYPRLVKIGKEIVKKCGGIPLAITTLASLLSMTTQERYWNSIKDNEIWKTRQEENGIIPILKLSYDRMPIHLKQCFAFCSTYSKDVIFSREKLMYLWISHGLIPSSDVNANMSLEEIAGQYIDDLLSMSFFQDVVYDFVGEAVDFKMHDLVHDLALLVVGKEVSHCDSKKKVHPSVRHLLFTEKSVHEDTFSKSLFKLEKVRSFRFKYDGMALTGKNWLDTLIKSFTCLRSLNLGGSEFEYLPETIGALRHLRYLKLDGNRTITKLPNSVCDLLNLIYLNLRGCDKLQILPTIFDKLRCLRYLDVTSKMKFMAEKDAEGLGSLRTLRIYKCEYMEDILKGGLQHLTSLGELSIQGCPKLKSIPQSMKFLISLKIMSIENCKEFDLLEGQSFASLRSLEQLYLKKLPSLKKLPLSVWTSSPTIQYLWIEDCPSLKYLEGLGCITSLLKLRIIKCKQLKSLSSTNLQQLKSMRYLQIKDCPLLTPKCRRDKGEYWPWISSIPQRSIE